MARAPRGLALGVLRGLAGALQAVLLAFLDARITGEEAGLAQRQAELFVLAEERAGDAVANCLRLAGHAAALHFRHDVVGAQRVGALQRLGDGLLVDEAREAL